MFCWDDSTSIQSEDKLDLIFELASDYNMTPVSVPPAMPLTKVIHFETDFGSSFSFFVVRFTSCSTFYDLVRFTSNSKRDWLVQLWKKSWLKESGNMRNIIESCCESWKSVHWCLFCFFHFFLRASWFRHE